MIRINLQSPEILARNRAVANAVIAMRARSYAARNPHLGKMINCAPCGRRHRQVLMVGGVQYACIQKFATGRVGSATEGIELIASQKTLKGVMGAASVAKKRFHPHHSHRKLQLVQRTQELYPYFAENIEDAQACMEEARQEAARELRGEEDLKIKRIRKTRDVSRRVNAGHAVPGSRYLAPIFRLIITKTRNARQDKQKARAKANLEAANGSNPS